ncbi:MAG: Presenilin-like membrane protease A22 family [Candidatus Methanohalarchaeum thermophilum]|uniref:Presenilin-like membrane protease A22 family n=1 Tax=Methanohalarchaeum thermophilum TaxID=1903181 RepID=A0A1Q6DUP6_METT1|nr:MAG: Presenilin-like membrane protease A22 family [Candidatus Methanohalarchaeum thermophilum]
MSIEAKKYLPMAGMGSLLVFTQLLGVYISSFYLDYNIKAFRDPQSAWNPLYFILLILIFTAGFLAVNKLELKWVVELFLSFAIFLTLVYFFMALFGKIFGLNVVNSILYGTIPAVTLLVLIFLFREWYVVDLVGLFVSSGAAAIFGISLDLIPALVLLFLLALYDALAVYKTKHMLSLAQNAIEMKIPVLFVVPKEKNYSFRSKTTKIGNKENKAFFMGLGDAVLPSILTISAYNYLGILPALGAFIGSLIGFIFLSALVYKGKPQAGLPLLNGGAIIGLLIALI